MDENMEDLDATKFPTESATVLLIQCVEMCHNMFAILLWNRSVKQCLNLPVIANQSR